MSIFVPVYRAKASQQTFLDREQRQERKRKRARESQGGQDGLLDAAPDEVSDARPAHPVSLTDPYYVAGHPRDRPLPGGNFPHAAPPSDRGLGHAQLSLEAEFAAVKPVVYVPSSTAETVNQTDSLRRRHLDNLTAILHRCMLDGDWARASRVWGLVLRTEIGGGAIDVRRHGRWTVSAELLMRRNPPAGDNSKYLDLDVTDDDARPALDAFSSDQGFSLAREYYERLILQYPHRVRASRDSVDALVVYPALFNVWIYEVQGRAERARKRLINADSEAESHGKGFDIDDIDRDTAEQMQTISIRELDEAHPILQRLEDLLSAPPFDTSPEILRYRGFVGAWMADVHAELADSFKQTMTSNASGDDEPASVFVNSTLSPVQHHRQAARAQREKASAVFRRLASLGVELSDDVLRFLADTDADQQRPNDHDEPH